jgi:hypothetical protein
MIFSVDPLKTIFRGSTAIKVLAFIYELSFIHYGTIFFMSSFIFIESQLFNRIYYILSSVFFFDKSVVFTDFFYYYNLLSQCEPYIWVILLMLIFFYDYLFSADVYPFL